MTETPADGTPYLGRRTLDHQVHLGNVQATGRYVGGHQNLEGPAPEAFEGDLPLLLEDVSMERLATLQEDGISIIRQGPNDELMQEHSGLLFYYTALMKAQF